MSEPDREKERHDLNTQLHHIISYAEIVKDQAVADGRANDASDLQRVVAAAQKLELLIADAFESREAVRTEEPKDEDEWVEIEDPSLQPVALQEGRLLVVDDESANRDVLSRRLEARGYVARSAASGREALQMIAEEDFDAVLLDIGMPEMNGFEVLRIIRENRDLADLPIIMVTARKMSADIVEALRLGANDYVTKPVDLAVAIARIATQLSLKQANQLVKKLNRDLSEAQAKIASIHDSSGEVLRDIPSWATSVAADLAETVHAREIAVYFERGGIFEPIGETSLSAPTAEEARTALMSRRFRRAGGDEVVGVAGMSGTLFGALLVDGKESPWSESERQLIVTFARQLGGALELQRIRGELEDEKQRRLTKRQDLIDRGIALLELCPRCGQCFASPAVHCEVDGAILDSRLVPIEIHGRYRLVQLLGRGGMGEVFRARDARLQRDVAVKVIAANHFNNKTVRQRFEREALALARIAHEGVVTIYDSGDLEDGSGFLVTELLRGWDLRNVLRLYGAGSPPQVADVVRQTGTALDAAHLAGLIHRDVKPANLFLIARDPFFQVKLLDFGVAKPVDVDPELTQSGMLVGTPAYMAPEVVNGDVVDIRSDLYSLAVVAYESLTGRGVTVQSGQRVWYDVLYREPPVVSSLVAGIGDDVDALFRAALAKDPAARPTMEAFIASMEMLDRSRSDRAGWPADLFTVDYDAREEWPVAKSVTQSITSESGIAPTVTMGPESQPGRT